MSKTTQTTPAYLIVRHDLHEQPEVIEIASLLEMTIGCVVSKLLQIWSFAESSTRDGRMHGISPDRIDQHVDTDGFAEAMKQTGWLRVHSTGCVVPRFGKYMGEGAKRRAVEPKRPKRAMTKQREETFEEFWDLYPAREGVKRGKAKAREEFANLAPSDVPKLMETLDYFIDTEDVYDGYSIPDAHRWIREPDNSYGLGLWREYYNVMLGIEA